MLLQGCTPPPREFDKVIAQYPSPNGENYLYKINTMGKGGWGSDKTIVYLSTEANALDRFPSNPLALFEYDRGCLEIRWESDFKVNVYHCVTEIGANTTKALFIPDYEIQVVFINSDLCNLDPKSLIIDSKCDTYFNDFTF